MQIRKPQAVPKIAVAGYGYWGTNLVRVFHELGALAAVCEPHAERRKACRQHYPSIRLTDSYKTLLKDSRIQAIAVATPAVMHAEMVRQALEAGKDVFVEKPICLDEKTGQELAELARKNKKILMVGHLLWYHPTVLKLQELIQSGTLGRIQYIYSNRLNLGKFRREENILWSFAPHDISVILGLVGEMPSQVTAFGGNYLHPQIADVTVSHLAFPNGVKAHIFVSWLHPFKEQKLVVVGDRQMAVFDDQQPPERRLLLYPHSIEWKNQIPIANKAGAIAVPTERTNPF